MSDKSKLILEAKKLYNKELYSVYLRAYLVQSG